MEQRVKTSSPVKKNSHLIQYDGSANGWQAQLGGRTVQDEIESNRVLLKEETRVVASAGPTRSPRSQ